MIDFNDTEKYNADEIKIFNDGQAGIVKGIAISVERKGTGDKENAPDFKVIATDEKGTVNEGLYFQDDDAKGFMRYQSQKLIWLARGIMGDDFKFPEFDSAKKALEEIMKLVATQAKGKSFNILVNYGTKKNPQRYLTFKEYGRFLQRTEEENKLEISPTDLMERPEIRDDTSSETEVANAVGGAVNEGWLND